MDLSMTNANFKEIWLCSPLVQQKKIKRNCMGIPPEQLPHYSPHWHFLEVKWEIKVPHPCHLNATSVVTIINPKCFTESRKGDTSNLETERMSRVLSDYKPEYLIRLLSGYDSSGNQGECFTIDRKSFTINLKIERMARVLYQDTPRTGRATRHISKRSRRRRSDRGCWTVSCLLLVTLSTKGFHHFQCQMVCNPNVRTMLWSWR